MEVLALRLTNEILVGEVMLVGKWKSDKKSILPFLCACMRVKGTPRGKRKALFLYVTAFMLRDGGGGCG